MIQPQPATDQVEASVDVLVRTLQAVLNIRRAPVVQELDFASPVNAVFTERSSQSRLKL